MIGEATVVKVDGEINLISNFFIDVQLAEIQKKYLIYKFLAGYLVTRTEIMSSGNLFLPSTQYVNKGGQITYLVHSSI